ncbi:MAG: type I 3-dehydroquinate dehydratase [Leptospiraceae bacterium]|nr:type I 3-dehydroquinate dehydratase [Leptospiraceae bacterium]
MSKYKIIATLDENNVNNFEKVIDSHPDIVEIRFDLLSVPFITNELSQMLAKWNKPIIFTYRRAVDSNQSKFTHLEFSHISKLIEKFNSTNNFLDIEFDNQFPIFQNFQNLQYRIIYSYHDFHQSISLSKMKELIFLRSYEQERKSIYKFAITPQNSTELIDFLENVRTLSIDYTIIGVAMGEIGLLSRIFGDFYGSSFTYCCVDSPKAPGQISIMDYRKFRKYIILDDVSTITRF